MDDVDTKGSETKAIIDLAASITPVEIGSHGHVKRIAIPSGWEIHDRDDERLLPVPSRKKCLIKLDDDNSFIKYINRHKIIDLSTIYCDASYITSHVVFNCIINDHGSHNDGQQWRDHTVNYEPVLSAEWREWSGKNNNIFSQVDFATFIEKNLDDIAEADGTPSGNQVLEMALSFHSTQDMRFKSAVRLQNGGINMSFVQDDDAQTLETTKMFDRIAIGVPVFFNGDAYQVTARLRYRIKEGKLFFWYDLIRPDRALEHATKKLIEKISNETGIPLYFGIA